MIEMLASITSVEEAAIVLEADVDIIDLKDPRQGALGALSIELISEIVNFVQGRKMVSATIGDLPMNASQIVQAAEKVASAGVDVVKVGFFGREHHEVCVNSLHKLSQQGVRLIAVLIADQQPDLSILKQLKHAGFYGAMLDTANKSGKTLLDYMLYNDLQRFVDQAHALDLKFGLAGSLSLQSIPQLYDLQPDYLGFRGALSREYLRVNSLNLHNILQVKNMLHKCNNMAAEACIY